MKVFVERRPTTGSFEVTWYERAPEGSYIVRFDSSGEWPHHRVELVPDNVRSSPSLILSDELWDALVAEIAPASKIDEDALADARRVRDRLLTLIEEEAKRQ